MELKFKDSGADSTEQYRRLEVEVPIDKPDVREFIQALYKLERSNCFRGRVEMAIGDLGSDRPLVLVDGENSGWDGRFRSDVI